MAIKDLTVHLDSGARTRARLTLAAELARRHGARLVGLFGQRAHAVHVGVVASWPSPKYVEAARTSRETFEAAAEGLATEWVDLNRGSDAELLRLAVQAVRCTDLAVFGQPDEQSGSAPVAPRLAEVVALDSGAPVLVVPYVGEYREIGRRPLIAWDDTRESANAVRAAMPLMEGCPEVVVVSLTAPREGAGGCPEVARYLASRGIRARVDVVGGDHRHAFDFLLSHVTEVSADLVVVGAHKAGSHSSRHGVDVHEVMRQMVVPTLLSS